MKQNMILTQDFYKICHKQMYPKGLAKLYSTWIPRSNDYFPESNKLVWFGLQGFIKNYLIEQFNEYFFNQPLDVILEEYKLYISNTFEENPNVEHFVRLHQIQYLPIEIKTLEEGSLVPYRIPCMTIENTHEDFAWLTNFLETLISCSLWTMSTSATVSYCFRQIIEKYVDLTSDNKNWCSVGCGDFSFRGMSSLESAITSGAAFLTSFTKTSTIPAIKYLCEYYNADITKENIGNWSASVEHSCTTSNYQIDGDEETFFKKMCTEIYPNGNFSFVADSYDYFNFLDSIVRKNKDIILNRNGCIRARPDSGCPIDIICGIKGFLTFNSIEEAKQYCKNDIITIDCFSKCYSININKKYYYIYVAKMLYKCNDISNNPEYIGITIEEINPTLEELGSLNILWDIFGGTINSKGYKVLDSHIGLVYGDAITLERCEAICKKMMEMGFAVENVIFGVGSYSLQYKTRDSQGWALKATYGIVDGKEILIYKDPKTDKGTKKSPRGKVAVIIDENGEYQLIDNLNCKTEKQIKNNQLKTIFKNGKLVRETSLSEIRNRLYGGDF